MIDSKQSDYAEIDLAIARGFSPYPPTLGILTTVSKQSDMQVHELSLEEIQEVAMNVSYLVIGAFDGEMLLFWERPVNICLK